MLHTGKVGIGFMGKDVIKRKIYYAFIWPKKDCLEICFTRHHSYYSIGKKYGDSIARNICTRKELLETFPIKEYDIDFKKQVISRKDHEYF
jgi:hypothetical protein